MADVPFALDRRAASRTQYVAPNITLRTLVATLVWLVFVANAGIIVWLWLAGGGISGVNSWGQLYTSLGRITGLLGAYLLLIQVLLLARLPFVERLYGFDRLTVWHRLNGKVTLVLVLAHVVLITIGYQLLDRISISREINLMLTIYPGMVEATIGTVFLMLVVVTSLVIIRRRLRYEAWYLVHFLAYAGIVLGWFHQLPTGNEFIIHASAATYWTGLYLATLSLLILFRLVQPVSKTWWHRLRVAEVTQEAPNVVSLRITGRNLDRLRARPGQFFLWRFLSKGRWWEAHPFSLSAAPTGDALRITVKHSGDFSGKIAGILPGTRVIAEGPMGVFTTQLKRRDAAVMIAGGIGITPIRALAEEMPGKVAVIYRAMRDSDLVFREELDRLANERDLTVHYVVGDHAAPGAEKLLAPEHLAELVPDITTRDVYICGPPAMADLIERHVRKLAVPRKQIHVERFAL